MSGNLEQNKHFLRKYNNGRACLKTVVLRQGNPATTQKSRNSQTSKTYFS